ncbi:10008_t:CDS:2 [Funneliformis geosporum]|nr:10008_t:CDS:2 [Funneliformis geosporum]
MRLVAHINSDHIIEYEETIVVFQFLEACVFQEVLRRIQGDFSDLD